MNHINIHTNFDGNIYTYVVEHQLLLLFFAINDQEIEKFSNMFFGRNRFRTIQFSTKS